MRVVDLKYLLEQFDDDVEIKAVHQPSWPLVEEIKGVYDPRNSMGSCEDECGHILDVHGEDGCQMCECGFVADPDKEVVLLLVVDGHPYEDSPYGPKQAFDDYIRP